MCKEWAADFWIFVGAVGDRPNGHKLWRHDRGKPLGPNNWFWREPIKKGEMTEAERARRYRNRSPGAEKNRGLKKRYGITLKEYDQLRREQKNVCKICEQPEPSTHKDGTIRELAVDHCHTTGRVRGLLCSNCNNGLGRFKDDTALLQKAIAYLDKPLNTN